MTAQAGDRIKIDGKWRLLCELPLEAIFKTVAWRPKFALTITSCWRGYIADWEILNGELYLVGFRAKIDTQRSVDLCSTLPFSVEDLLSSEQRPLYADWYSGTLRLPKGEVLEYVHMGFLSTWEFDHFVEIECGKVIREWEVDNRIAHALRQARAADSATRTNPRPNAGWLRSFLSRKARTEDGS